MNESRSATQFSSEKPSANDRLDSWKGIALYLKREVRTVQRWEKREGLPVYRHTHSNRASVYAYKAELDAWWNNRRPRLEQEGSETQARRLYRRRWVLLAASIVSLVVLAFPLWRFGPGHWPGKQPSLAFDRRDWLLIASFANRTGEPLFDGSLEHALERELSNSQFVNVVPRQRIEDALRLMKKPTDATVDVTLGREICLRDGGIRALLAGRVEKLGSRYILSATVVDPIRGISVGSLSEDAADQEQVLRAVRRLSNGVRKLLGEALPVIQQSEQKLDKVTTPSLRALQLYTQGMALVNEAKWEPAAEVLRQAVAEDPEFASAHILLAWALRDQIRPEWMLKREPNPEWARSRQRKLEADRRAHSERAFQLAARTTDRERYFILGSYYLQRRQYEEALPHFEALVRLYPDDYWGTNNLAYTYAYLRRWREAVEYFARQADMRPHDFGANLYAAHRLAVWQNDTVHAKRYVQRARALPVPEHWKNTLPADLVVAWLELLPAFEAWHEGDVAQADRQVTGVARTLGSRTAYERDQFGYMVGLFYLRLGKLKAAAEACEKMVDAGGRTECLAVVALERGNKPALREQMRAAARVVKADWPPFGPYYMPLLIRARQLAEAEEAILRFRKESPPPARSTLKHVEGQVALARGRRAEAIELLAESLGQLRQGPERVPFSFAAESLGHAWEEQGNLAKAIEVLEDASQEKSRPALSAGPLWLRIQLELAKLYRKVGREQEARKIEADLLELLALADPDHPMFLQLKRSEALAVAQPPM